MNEVPYVPGPAPLPPPVHPHPTPLPRKRMAAWKVVTLTLAIIAVLCGGTVIAGVAMLGADAKITANKPADSSTGTGQLPVTGANDKPKKASTFKAPVGATITAEFDEGTVSTTVTAARWQTKGCDNSSFSKPDLTYVVIDVTMTVVSGKGSVNPLFFEFTAVDSSSAHTAIFSGCADLGAGNGYPAGTTKKGQVVFDTRRGSGELFWSTFTEQIGSWVIPG